MIHVAGDGNMRQQLEHAIKKNKLEQYFKLFGYVIKMEPDMANEFIFNAYRDKQDPIIGDGSIHNRLLKSNKRQGQLDLG